MRDGGRVLAKQPTKPKMSAAMANLQRGDVLMVERVDDDEPGTWYVQVLMREDNQAGTTVNHGCQGKPQSSPWHPSPLVNSAMGPEARCFPNSGFRRTARVPCFPSARVWPQGMHPRTPGPP